MDNRSNLCMEHDLFSAEEKDGIAVLRFKDRPMDHVVDLDVKKILFDYLDRISACDGIKILLIMGANEKMAYGEYIDFYQKLLRQDYKRTSLERMYHIRWVK